MAMNPLNRKLDKNGNPIISKAELEASGMSLRDFLNKERGLTRRTSNSDLEPPHIDAEAGMTRGTRPKQANSTTEAGMSGYTPRREPKPLTEVMKPGTRTNYENEDGMKRGGKVKASKMGSVKTSKPAMSSASRRADGIATKGKTRGRFV